MKILSLDLSEISLEKIPKVYLVIFFLSFTLRIDNDDNLISRRQTWNNTANWVYEVSCRQVASRNSN